jgi:hypothetical protein
MSPIIISSDLEKALKDLEEFLEGYL